MFPKGGGRPLVFNIHAFFWATILLWQSISLWFAPWPVGSVTAFPTTTTTTPSRTLRPSTRTTTTKVLLFQHIPVFSSFSFPKKQHQHSGAISNSRLDAVPQDLEVVSLVAGQENYGLAIVCVAEAIWSFVQAPSLDQVVKILVPAVVAAAVLGLVSGPMIPTTYYY